eukprot:3547936-Rhodomonas_salina.1
MRSVKVALTVSVDGGSNLVVRWLLLSFPSWFALGLWRSGTRQGSHAPEIHSICSPAAGDSTEGKWAEIRGQRGCGRGGQQSKLWGSQLGSNETQCPAPGPNPSDRRALSA